MLSHRSRAGHLRGHQLVRGPREHRGQQVIIRGHDVEEAPHLLAIIQLDKQLAAKVRRELGPVVELMPQRSPQVVPCLPMR